MSSWANVFSILSKFHLSKCPNEQNKIGQNILGKCRWANWICATVAQSFSNLFSRLSNSMRSSSISSSFTILRAVSMTAGVVANIFFLYFFRNDRKPAPSVATHFFDLLHLKFQSLGQTLLCAFPATWNHKCLISSFHESRIFREIKSRGRKFPDKTL